MRQMICGLACLLWMCHALAGATVSTEDGLSIQFQDADASVSAVLVHGKAIKLNGTPGGFYVADMIGDKLLGKMGYKSQSFPATRLAATARPSPTGVVIEGKVNDLWVRARIDSRGNYLTVTGDLVNLRPQQDRAAILYFRLPIDATDAAWGKNLGDEEPIAAGPHRYINPSYFHQAYRPAMSRLPIATISGQDWGLTMAQPMDVPRFFRLAYEQPYGFQIEYEFGLSPITWKFRNRAPFQFLLYRHDPSWGLRSAFDRYYQFFPEQFRKVVRDGMWIDDWEGKRKDLGDPADFGIVFNETGNWADAQQRSQDVLSMKYIEPWCDHIEALPDQIPEMARDVPENHKAARFGRGADLRTNALQILNTAVYTADGKILDPRAAAVGGFYVEGKPDNPYYRYLTNPDPELPTPFGGLNRAQKISQYDLYTNWGRKTDEHQFSQDGIYYDSIGGSWVGSHLHNFRRDHMPTVDVPLTFDHKTGKVTITHGFSCVKYLRFCTLQARNDGRPTMGNSGAGDFLMFDAPWLDMGGAGENFSDTGNFSDLKEIRALMHAKPLSYLNNTALGDPAKAEPVMDALLLYACYPGARDVKSMVAERHLYRAYIPIYNALGKAGWEPVPYARVTGGGDSHPWCERFGHGNGGYFFAIRNPGDAAELTLAFSDADRRALRLDTMKFAAINGCTIKNAAENHVVLDVPAHWTAVVAVNRDDFQAMEKTHREEMDLHRASAARNGP